MKFSTPVSVAFIADMIHAKVYGNNHAIITGINEIHKVEPGDIVFVDHLYAIHWPMTLIDGNKILPSRG